MEKIKSDRQNKMILPEAFLTRRQLPSGMEFWLSERDGDIILHPRLPDVRKLYIEVTTGCNLQCRTCIRNVWSDPIAAMNWDTFQRIVDSLKNLPALDRVIFTSFGEPLTHPHILDMIEAVRRFDVAVTVGTNGLLLKPEISKSLIELGVDRVIISIDGGKPETFEAVRGAMLSQVIENMRGLNNAKHQLGSLFPALGAEFVIMKSNCTELSELAALAAELDVSKILVSNVLAYTEEMRKEILYSYEPQEPYKFNGWMVKAGGWVMWATLELPRMHWGANRRCRFVKDKSIVVGWDGGISPCYALSHNYNYFAIDGKQKQVSRYMLGNVKDESLADIWMSEEYARFRSEVNAYYFPSCPDCDLRETCDLRERNEGCWGWNPSCADCLWSQDIIRCP
jgi:tungsten cofactor oxidoreducase radical SAM maturase